MDSVPEGAFDLTAVKATLWLLHKKEDSGSHTLNSTIYIYIIINEQENRLLTK